MALVNLLPMPGRRWAELISAWSEPFDVAIEIRLDSFENRLLLVGDRLPSTRVCGRLLRRRIRAIGSSLAEEMSLFSVPRGRAAATSGKRGRDQQREGGGASRATGG